MGRRSLKEERVGQILLALFTSLEQYGYAGTTLERVSKISGMSRSHIRHYVGNREALLKAGAHAFFVHDEVEIPENEDVEEQRRAVLEWLFGDDFVEPGRPNRIVRAFFDASNDYPNISKIVGNSYEHRYTSIAALLRRSIPTADEAEIRRRASVILLLALGNAYIADVDFTYVSEGHARAASEALLEREVL